MKYIKIHIIIYFLLISCTSNTILKKPDDLIPPDKMEDLLIDMFIASGAKKTINVSGKQGVNYYPYVFQKHKIDSAQFRRSSYYYTSKIDAYDDILKRVEKRLKYIKDSVSNSLHIRDSLNNIIIKKRRLLSNNKQSLRAYDIVFKEFYKINDSILNKKDSLANHLAPLSISKKKECREYKLPYFSTNFKRIPSFTFLKKEQEKHINTIYILQQLNESLKKKGAAKEILQEIQLQKDSLRYVAKKIKKDTIVYFPLKTSQNKEVVLDSSYIKLDKYIDILKRMKVSLENKKETLKCVIEKQDSIFKAQTQPQGEEKIFNLPK